METFFSYAVFFILCMAICEVGREMMTLVRCYIKAEPYIITDYRMIAAWVAVSYIITYIVFA